MKFFWKFLLCVIPSVVSGKGLRKVQNNPSLPKWSIENGEIQRNGDPFEIRGISWFGFETEAFVTHGLYSHSMDFYFDKLDQVGINALRIPFSAEWIFYNLNTYPNNGMIAADPSLQGKKCIEILDTLFDKAEDRGIAIMLDLHRLHKEYISELWYSPTDGQYPSNVFIEVWKTMLDRYKDRPNLMAVDLLNEPHGRATWGSGNPSTDWAMFVEYAVTELSSSYPNHHWLYFVEGINWGHDLQDYNRHPLQLSEELQKRVIFSPHVYGSSVVPGTSNDPGVLYPHWDWTFGFLKSQHDKTVVVGEWGGRTDLDANWMNILVQYLSGKGMNSNFFWSLMPNSGDVKGLLLDDYTTLDNFKVGVIQQLTPNAKKFVW